MKKIFFGLLCLFLFLGFVSSCSIESDNTKTESDINYWERNDLVHMQLRGNVKSLTEGDHSYNFNNEGFIQSENEKYGSATYFYDYHYSNEKLDSVLITNFFRYDTVITRCYYEYNNIGKYVPVTDDGFSSNNRLIPGLSAIKGEINRVLFDMLDDTTMQITHQYVDEHDRTKWHTTLQSTVVFSGKYPKSLNCEYSGLFTDFMYASNGMYSSYSKNHDKYTFLVDNEYLRLSNYVHSTDDAYTVILNYNEHRDLLTYLSPVAFYCNP